MVLTRGRRRLSRGLVVLWTVAGVAALATGRDGLLWLPVLGLFTSSFLLWRDRAGRRRQRQTGGRPPGP